MSLYCDKTKFILLQRGFNFIVSFEVVYEILAYAAYLHFLVAELLILQGVFYEEFVERTVLGCVFEDRFSFFSEHAYHVVELHEDASVGNSQYFQMVLGFLFFDDVSFNKQFQEIKAATVHVFPAFTLSTLVLSDSLFLFIGLLLPKA
jgi:hypothetical protein